MASGVVGLIPAEGVLCLLGVVWVAASAVS